MKKPYYYSGVLFINEGIRKRLIISVWRDIILTSNKLKEVISLSEANKDLIEWVLNDSRKTIAEIAKGSDMPWTTVSDLKKGESDIDKMSLDNAIKLTEYGRSIGVEGEVLKMENVYIVWEISDLGKKIKRIFKSPKSATAYANSMNLGEESSKYNYLVEVCELE